MKQNIFIIGVCLFTLWVLFNITSSHFNGFIFLLMTSVCFFLLGYRQPIQAARSILLNLTMVISIITVLEVASLLHYRIFIQNAVDVPRYNYGRTQYWIEDDELGYRPRPSMLITARKEVNNKIVYDTEYTIDSHGLRKTKSAGTSQCSFLFFGGSTAFGEGLPDAHTLPSQFSRALNYNYGVFNFGFHGYGPHQMLRTLQKSVHDKLFDNKIAVIFYVLSSEDGLQFIGAFRKYYGGPKYVITNGGPVYVGNLNSMSGALNSWNDFVQSSLMVLRNSQLFSLLYGYPDINNIDFINSTVQLISAIFSESQLLIKEKFNARFVVIHWSDTSVFSKEIVNALKNEGIIVIDKAELLLQKWNNDYHIVNEKYPSGKANKEMAAGLSNQFGFCQ